MVCEILSSATEYIAFITVMVTIFSRFFVEQSSFFWLFLSLHSPFEFSWWWLIVFASSHSTTTVVAILHVISHTSRQYIINSPLSSVNITVDVNRKDCIGWNVMCSSRGGQSCSWYASCRKSRNAWGCWGEQEWSVIELMFWILRFSNCITFSLYSNYWLLLVPSLTDVVAIVHMLRFVVHSFSYFTVVNITYMFVCVCVCVCVCLCIYMKHSVIKQGYWKSEDNNMKPIVELVQVSSQVNYQMIRMSPHEWGRGNYSMVPHHHQHHCEGSRMGSVQYTDNNSWYRNVWYI